MGAEGYSLQTILLTSFKIDMTPISKLGDSNFTSADPWVIASAWFVGGTVITHESTSRRRKIRIPVVCQHFGVPFTEQARWEDESHGVCGCFVRP